MDDDQYDAFPDDVPAQRHPATTAPSRSDRPGAGLPVQLTRPVEIRQATPLASHRWRLFRPLGGPPLPRAAGASQ